MANLLEVLNGNRSTFSRFLAHCSTLCDRAHAVLAACLSVPLMPANHKTYTQVKDNSESIRPSSTWNTSTSTIIDFRNRNWKRASNRLRKVKRVVVGHFLLLFDAKGFVSISLFLESLCQQNSWKSVMPNNNNTQRFFYVFFFNVEYVILNVGKRRSQLAKKPIARTMGLKKIKIYEVY